MTPDERMAYESDLLDKLTNAVDLDGVEWLLDWDMDGLSVEGKRADFPSPMGMATPIEVIEQDRDMVIKATVRAFQQRARRGPEGPEGWEIDHDLAPGEVVAGVFAWTGRGVTRAWIDVRGRAHMANYPGGRDDLGRYGSQVQPLANVIVWLDRHLHMRTVRERMARQVAEAAE